MLSQKNSALTAFLALAMLVVSGCKPSTQAPEGASEAGAVSVATPPVPAASGKTVLELVAADPKVRTQVGVKEAGALVSTGKAGVLAFGPYQSLPAGRYLVSLRGSASKPFSLDVVSNIGKQVHGRKQFAAQESADTLASLPFDLAAPVQNLEVRILIPEGSDAKVVGYKIVTR